MATWCNEGKSKLGAVFLTGASAVNKYLGLYTNSSEPSETASVASLGEPTGASYARVQVLDANWTEQTASAYGEFKNVQKTFSASESWGTICGYFICTAITGTACSLLAVDTFAFGPYAVASGNAIKIIPSISFA